MRSGRSVLGVDIRLSLNLNSRTNNHIPKTDNKNEVSLGSGASEPFSNVPKCPPHASQYCLNCIVGDTILFSKQSDRSLSRRFLTERPEPSYYHGMSLRYANVLPHIPVRHLPRDVPLQFEFPGTRLLGVDHICDQALHFVPRRNIPSS